jgi:hypothetical protein
MALGKSSPGVYEFEGRKLLIGDHARIRAEQEYQLELEWLLAAAPVFAFHALTLAHCENEDTIVVGLPPEYFFGHQDRLRQRLTSFVVNGRPYGFRRVYVLPQGVGSYYFYCSQFRPNKDDVSLLIDIGAYTLNSMLAIGEMVMPEESVQFSRSGACLPAMEVMAMMRRRDIIISQAQAHHILRTGQFDGEDIAGLPDILRRFAQQILDRIYNHYASHTLTRIILSGGGAALIRDYLPQSHRLAAKCRFVDEPEYNNVCGYHLVGQTMLAEHNYA